MRRAKRSVEVVDVEEDEMLVAWVVAPIEACWFSAVAVFLSKRDAVAHARTLNDRKRRRKAHPDFCVLAARAYVHAANTFDAKAGRWALGRVAT